MASIRKAKKLAKKQGVVFRQPDAQRKRLQQETREMINEVNRRLRNLERGGNYNSYASKKLFNRLDTKTLDVLNKSRKGKHVLGVKLKRGLTNTQLKAIQKASKQFLTSQTSTSRGIRQVSEQTKKSMLETLRMDEDSKITSDDIEDYYEMLSSNDFEYFNDKIGASAMWGLMEDAKEMDVDENGFVKMLNQYITLNDEDVRNKAIRLYNKYII